MAVNFTSKPARRYQKTMYGNDSGAFYSWTCRDEDGEISTVCPEPSSGTSRLAGLPDHFPRALR